MSFREEMQEPPRTGERTESGSRSLTGAPGGARQNVRSETEQGAAARPGGATQNSGGAIEANGDGLDGR